MRIHRTYYDEQNKLCLEMIDDNGNVFLYQDCQFVKQTVNSNSENVIVEELDMKFEKIA